MHVHILGICGTFMGGIAAIAKAAGHRVTGSDQNVYPPMSTQLESLGDLAGAPSDVSTEVQAPWESGRVMELPQEHLAGRDSSDR